MRKMLLALTVSATLATGAYAAPAVNDVLTGYTTIACDTAEQIESILRAEDPAAAYALFNQTPSTNGAEPACITGTFSEVTVLSVKPTGPMEMSGRQFETFALEVRGHVNGAVFWLLHSDEVGVKPTRHSGKTPFGIFA